MLSIVYAAARLKELGVGVEILSGPFSEGRLSGRNFLEMCEMFNELEATVRPVATPAKTSRGRPYALDTRKTERHAGSDEALHQLPPRKAGLSD